MSALTGIAAARRDIIAASALGPLWITRDSDPITGELDLEVDVWTSLPVRHTITITDTGGRSSTWVTGEFDVSGRLCALPLAAALAAFPTLPDDDRQCIVIG